MVRPAWNARRVFTWRAIETGGLWIGTDTHLSNRIVEEREANGISRRQRDRIVRAIVIHNADVPVHDIAGENRDER